jgi:hypothetical protein
MLYNQDWDKLNLERDLTLERMTAWLETQSRWKSYRYMNNQDCIIARYLKAMGYAGVRVGASVLEIRNSDGIIRIMHLPTEMNKVAHVSTGWCFYGMALRLARKLLKHRANIETLAAA